jgi:hypothetical protein
MRICMVCIRIKESGSYQDSANGMIWIWEPLYIQAFGPERSVNQVIQASKVTANVAYPVVASGKQLRVAKYQSFL